MNGSIKQSQATYIFAAIERDVCMNIESNRDHDWMKLLVSDVRNRFEKIKLGGGKKAIAKTA